MPAATDLEMQLRNRLPLAFDRTGGRGDMRPVVVQPEVAKTEVRRHEQEDDTQCGRIATGDVAITPAEPVAAHPFPHVQPSLQILVHPR